MKLERIQGYHKCQSKHQYLRNFHQIVFHIKCTRDVELCNNLPLLNIFPQANNHCISTS